MQPYLWMYFGRKFKTTVLGVSGAEHWIKQNEHPTTFVILRTKHIALRYRWNGEHLVQV